MSLKDQLLKAGVVNEGDIQRVETADGIRQHDEQARRLATDGSVRGIAARWQDHLDRADGFEAQIAAANGWIGELRNSEFRGAFRNKFGEPDLAVLRTDDPAEEKALRKVEKKLGWALPPSYREFLLTVGTVALRTYDWDAMVPVDQLVRETAALRKALPDLPPHAVAFAREADSNVFALLEGPEGDQTVLHWVHDDEDDRGPATFAHWFAHRLDYTIEWFTDRLP